MNVETIKENLPDIWKELKIELYQEISSTNDWAKKHVRENPEDEILLVSKKQTKGRGRLGRSFYSKLDHGLYFSLAIHPKNIDPKELTLYTIAAATALIQAVDTELGLELQVKWVNDLFYQKQKVSGILTEAITDSATNKISSLVIGIGLNLAGSFKEADSTTQEVAGTLYEKLPTDFNINKLLQEFLVEFGRYHHNLTAKEFLPIYEKKLLGIGREVSYKRKNEVYFGVIQGVNGQGQLLVKNKQGELLTLLGEEIHFSSKQFRKGMVKQDENS